MSLAQRSITSTTWMVVSNLASVVVLFVRSVMLARLLPVEVFGVYAFASSLVILTSVLSAFGMGGAFLYRAKETEDIDEAAAVHFTLRLLFNLVWALVLAGFAFGFTTGQTRTALLVLTATTACVELTQTPQLILTRRVVHRRLALIQLVIAVLTTAVALGLAWTGATLWALLSTDLVTLVLTVVGLYIWRPVWRPRLTWSPPAMRYFLRFGSRNLVATLLLRALDRVDDLWTALFLGETPLGYYSRAYTFAVYPRRVLAIPINTVVKGTYAELKEDRLRLSKAFFRVNAFLLRTGFLFAGLLSLLAPEFIRLFLGAKWLPMLSAFRLMLVYTLLDPIKITLSHVFVAVGRPEKIVQARTVQLVVMVVGLFLLGPWLGIDGVAIAVDLMLVVGIIILMWMVRAHVDFSLRRLMITPSLALVVGLVLGSGVVRLLPVGESDWLVASLKLLVFSIAYGAVCLILERSEILDMLRIFGGRFLRSGRLPRVLDKLGD